MRFLATFMLMMSLLAMSVGVASADIKRPSCSSQIRVQDMCYEAGVPGSQAETVRKPGLCFVCLTPCGSDVADPVRPEIRVHAVSGAAVPADARRTGPWRPPRA
ncbi:hypothetical protein [uncultured Paracoccus sp.]|uniref:hypothetical protein n=1 Tax=uncultured Paracoccus sp. TaxID=189685 RepID=UPI0025EC81BF|nr:hypothetical protein [uncultured Paracoccus sp.]